MPRLGRETVGDRLRRRTSGVRGRTRFAADLVDGGELAELPLIGWVFVVIALVGLVLLLAFVLVPLLIVLAELGILVVAALLGVAARVVLRRPWLIDAHHPDGRALRWRVVGWRESGRVAAEARELVDAGIVPPDAEVLAIVPDPPTVG
jgi:hypothetical protein